MTIKEKKTKLIIVEGLPASGKSTAAQNIADILSKSEMNVVCFDEGMPDHPADYDNYDFPDFETERKLILEKWRDFISNSLDNTIYVFNCIFLQNPMCETMMRFGMSETESSEYISEIADIIRPMNPFIIYLKQSNIKNAIEDVLTERGEEWLNAVIGYHIEQGYGIQNNLSGFDGYISCLEERQKRELNILNNVNLDYKILNAKPSKENLMHLL